MASLFHDVTAMKIGAIRSDPQTPSGQRLDITASILKRVRPNNTFTLDIGEWDRQWDALQECGDKAGCLLPRNESLWIEGVDHDGSKVAVWLTRSDGIPNGHRVNGLVLGRVQAVVCVYGSFWCDLDRLGKFIQGQASAVLQEAIPDIRRWMSAALWVCFITHCKNVHMEQISAPKARRRWTRDQVPATVWHRISATAEGLPKNLLGGTGIFRDESKFRQYRVRGTIRSAPNHPITQFRGPFWIPDHWRGNPEFGQVIPEYTLA